MRKHNLLGSAGFLGLVSLVVGLGGPGCASGEKARNRAKESATRYWQDKAYPGKSFDVQVIEVDEAGDGSYWVKGIVDRETRVGLFNPKTGTFTAEDELTSSSAPKKHKQ